MVFVVGNTGIPLMPTSEYRARKLLKSGKAKIYKHDPFFTIQLLTRENGEVAEAVEYCTDFGYSHAGISVKSGKHEFISEQRDMLEGEADRNRDRKNYRRARRNNKWHREKKFDNRKKKPVGEWEKWFPPSVRHRAETQLNLFRELCKVCPVTSAYFEMGKFDTQLLAAVEAGKPEPEGTDYQHGPRYMSETLRQAVFSRDGYTCQCPGCGRNAFKDGAKLHVHHIGFWKKDRTDRLPNLMTVCEECHTSQNHKKGGKLYGIEPELKPFKGATFMTAVRFEVVRMAKKTGIPIHMTYGAGTKCTRKELSIEKSHANDAYCIGELRPKHRSPTHVYQKLRRNDRSKERFYDAKYIDIRTGEKVKASELGCGRTKRNTHLNYENLKKFRGKKTDKGHRSISWGMPRYLPDPLYR